MVSDSTGVFVLVAALAIDAIIAVWRRLHQWLRRRGIKHERRPNDG